MWRRSGWALRRHLLYRGSSYKDVMGHSVRGRKKGNESRETHSRGVAGEEMVAGLLGCEFADRGQHTERIAGQHDDVTRLAVNDTRDLGIGDELDGIRATGVLCDAHVVVIGNTAAGVVDDVLEDRSVPDGVKDFWLLLGGKIDAFGIAASFDVEYTSIRPYMLVVTNEETMRISRESGLPRARKAEEEGDITGFHSHIGGRMKRELTKFNRL